MVVPDTARRDHYASTVRVDRGTNLIPVPVCLLDEADTLEKVEPLFRVVPMFRSPRSI
jgi:hypothetical protein